MFMISFIFFVLSPLLSLPVTLVQISRRNKSAVVIFALFLGTIAYCTIPLQDLFRHLIHYENFATYKDISNINAMDFEMHGILCYIYYFMGKLSIPFDYYRLITVPLGYLLLFKIFYFKISNSPVLYTNSDYFIRFLIFTFYFDLFYTIAGVRFGFALCLYVFALYLLFERQNKLGCLLFLVLASLFHFSFLFFSFVSLAIYKAKMNIQNVLLYSVVAFVFMNIFFNHFGFLLGTRASWYLNKTSGVTNYSSMTLNGLLGFFLPKLCVLPYVFILLKNYSFESKWMRIGLSWFLLSVICFSNAVFFYRIWWVFLTIGIYMYLDYEKRCGINSVASLKILFASICFAVFSIIPVVFMVTKSNYSRLILPLPFLLDDHFSSKDILKENPAAGDFTSNN